MDIGARLRDARESRGLTIDALSRSTRVQPRILSAIERNDSVALPPRPYGRGFVRAYASEVGLDPDGTVREFFSQFGLTGEARVAPAPRPVLETDAPRGGRPWFWPVAAVAGYALVGTLVIVMGQWALKRQNESGAVGTAGSAVPAAAATPERQPATTPAPPPSPPIGHVVVALEARQIAWIAANVDGERKLYRLLQPGERISLDGTREISIRVGDAGAVLWQVNGRPAEPMGESGRVRTVLLTPENAARRK
jgi:transcriptional regulator with XRE-family HTH domain